jgi:hypothetical protein
MHTISRYSGVRSRGSLTLGRFLALLIFGVALAGVPAVAGQTQDTSASAGLLRGDARLRQTLTIRVSRTPLSDLLQRIEKQTGVALAAEGADVADQKVDLFTHEKAVSAAEIMTAITDLLNAEAPPRSFRWARAGQSPNWRYLLVRDVASRQWEAQQATAAEERLFALVRERIAALSKEEFRPESAQRWELPSMRKLLPTLSEAQLTRLCAERYLILPVTELTDAQRVIFRQMADEMFAYLKSRRPALLGGFSPKEGWPQNEPDSDLDVLLLGDAPRYRIEVGIDAPPLGQSEEVCRLVDAEALGRNARRPGQLVLSGGSDPAFALPSRSKWLMGDVLADIAARARVNLIADDYTQDWSQLARYKGAQPLSKWLEAIQGEYGFVVDRTGNFLRLRDSVWWLDRKHEIPTRFLERWAGWLRGTNADRLQMLVEMARLVPYSRHPRILDDRLRVLSDSPELVWTGRQEGQPGNTGVLRSILANHQLDLLVYDSLPPARRRAVGGPGVTMRWLEMPPDLRKLILRSFTRPRTEAEMRGSSLFIRFSEDRLSVRWDTPGQTYKRPTEITLPAKPGDDPRQLVGRTLPVLQVEAAPDRAVPLRVEGPALLYVTPVWPRPLVAQQEGFEDLKALQSMKASQLHLLATGATAKELRDWWGERRGTLLPRVLRLESAREIGARDLPLAIVVDAAGRVTWMKEGYAAGDEAEWRRQLGRVGG